MLSYYKIYLLPIKKNYKLICDNESNLFIYYQKKKKKPMPMPIAGTRGIYL